MTTYARPSLFGSDKAAKPLASYKPMLEIMEDRQVPAVAAYQAISLVSDQPGAAATVDPTLINAWGIATVPNSSSAWVTANGTDLAKLYPPLASRTGNGAASIAIPGDGVTGVVYNPTKSFQIRDSLGRRAPATLLFASESGVISAWSSTLSATRGKAVEVARLDTSMFTGLTIANNGEADFLYAADFRNRMIQVFDTSFTQAMVNGPRARFVDPGLPDGYAPFNIQNLNGTLYVTYALQNSDGTDDVPGAGHGFVSAFDPNGNFLGRVASQGVLNSPWGLALAPSGFGDFGNALLVGNSGDGMIHAFDPKTGEFLGTVSLNESQPVAIDGLHGIAFGATSSTANTLYFAAGPGNEQHGLFGQITATNNFNDEVDVKLHTTAVSRSKLSGMVVLSNSSGVFAKPMTLFITNLPAGVKVANASGMTPGGYFITINPTSRNTQDLKIRVAFTMNSSATFSLADMDQIQLNLVSSAKSLNR